MVVWFSVVILLIIIISGHFGNIPILGLFGALSLKKNGLQYGQVGYLLNEGQKCSNLELKDNQFDEFWPSYAQNIIFGPKMPNFLLWMA